MALGDDYDMIGTLLPSGELVNVRSRACGEGPGDVPVRGSLPPRDVEWGYNAATQRATAGATKLSLEDARTLVLADGDAAPREAKDLLSAEADRIKAK